MLFLKWIRFRFLNYESKTIEMHCFFCFHKGLFKGCDGTGFCATGHVDLINKAICDRKCYFSATGGVFQIVIWTLN